MFLNDHAMSDNIVCNTFCNKILTTKTNNLIAFNGNKADTISQTCNISMATQKDSEKKMLFLKLFQIHLHKTCKSFLNKIIFLFFKKDRLGVLNCDIYMYTYVQGYVKYFLL